MKAKGFALIANDTVSFVEAIEDLGELVEIGADMMGH